jgi:type IV pilus assembly protein PilW
MANDFVKTFAHSKQSAITLIELLVALTISAFLMIGAAQVFDQGRHAFAINESIARVQETAQFAMDTLEADLRLASNWGMLSDAAAVDGRSVIGNVNPRSLPAPTTCGIDWALDLSSPIEGDNNLYGLPCAAVGGGGAQINSDTITTRRVAIAPVVPRAGRLQIQSTRLKGRIFANGEIPGGFVAADSETHDLTIHTYYVAANSRLAPGVPSLRRKTLVGGASGPRIIDQEVIPGVENIQLQLGIDVDQDNAVDRYVNPGNALVNQLDASFASASRVIAVRLWIMVRGIESESGITDDTRYSPGDVDLGTYNDSFRRMQVSKTILLRNTRSH